ncbi:hypothetical protein CR513_26160, partial [Mucuna pruriens]
MKGENLKGYLVKFNNAMVQVNDPDQKFVQQYHGPAFQKGLRARQFSDSLTLRRPSNMEEIRTRTKLMSKRIWLTISRQNINPWHPSNSWAWVPMRMGTLLTLGTSCQCSGKLLAVIANKRLSDA